VTTAVEARTPDIAILDLQIGSMGGMAVTMNLRHDESSGALDHVPVLMLLDREVDTFLARRSGADGWLVKPLDPFAITRAVHAVLNPPAPADGAAAVSTDESAEEEAVAAG
ncbi:MAG TPA: response regulator, partial [Ilumatobacteraceae bacterium]|nr:response regulator [Ilumatobacteraceae bacterium]